MATYVAMSLAELKDNVLALPTDERHPLLVWINRLEANYGDVPGEALDQLSAEIWDQDDRHASPTHTGPNPRAEARQPTIVLRSRALNYDLAFSAAGFMLHSSTYEHKHRLETR